MIRYSIFIVFATIAPAGNVFAQNDGKSRIPDEPRAALESQAPLPEGRRLREIAPSDGTFPILVGGSINFVHFGTPAEVILNREFAFVTPGNDFKQSAIHPEPDVWRWKKPDAWLEPIEKNNQIVRMHSAISPQCSTWAKDDSRTGEELAKNMEEYLTAVCSRYNDNPRIKYMDVVNETISRDGTWFGPREGNTKWENPWIQIGIDKSTDLGVPLYISRAFEIADRNAKNVKLIYNQHGSMEKAMWRRLIATVTYLKAKGLRVDGIGWQGHIDSEFEKDAEKMKMLNALIDWCHNNNLEFHVTENTVWIRDDQTLEDQAATYAAIVQTLIDHSDKGIVSWNTWQMRDIDTERAELRGCIFHADGSPKPAYYAIQKVLEAVAR